MIGYIACPKCDGSGVVQELRRERWIDRDTPPEVYEYDVTCPLCQGDGEFRSDKDEDDGTD